MWTHSEFSSSDPYIIWHGFCNSTTLIGTLFKSVSNAIYTLDVSRPDSQPKLKRDKLDYKNFTFSYDGKSWVGTNRKSLYFIDLYNNDAVPLCILSDFERIVKKDVNKDRVSVLFIENGKYYFALFVRFEKTMRRVFKTLFDLSFQPIEPIIHSNEDNEIIYYEKSFGSSKKVRKANRFVKSVSQISSINFCSVFSQ